MKPSTSTAQVFSLSFLWRKQDFVHNWVSCVTFPVHSCDETRGGIMNYTFTGKPFDNHMLQIMIFHAFCAVWLVFILVDNLKAHLKFPFLVVVEKLTLCLPALVLESSCLPDHIPWESSRGLQSIISNIKHVCSFGKSPLRQASRSRSSPLPWAWASLCFLSCGRRIQPGPFVSISTAICWKRIMLCDPKQHRVLKITVFCGAASWFKKCCGTRWYPVFRSITFEMKGRGSAERQHFEVSELWH